MYARHRFPTEIISYAVWLYFTFPLSYRDVQKLLLYRGIDASHEAIHAWCQKFGQQYANQIRRRRPRPADKWHLDEVELKINGKKYYLWRTVDADGNVFDILMQRHRDKAAAKKFFRKLLKKQGFAPRVMVTDKLKSYDAAKPELLPTLEHRGRAGRKCGTARLKKVSRISSSVMKCSLCGHDKPHKHGKTSKGSQRYFCPNCRQTFTNTFDTLYYRRQVSEEDVRIVLLFSCRR